MTPALTPVASRLAEALERIMPICKAGKNYSDPIPEPVAVFSRDVAWDSRRSA